jgi:hypothetical protein
MPAQDVELVEVGPLHLLRCGHHQAVGASKDRPTFFGIKKEPILGDVVDEVFELTPLDYALRYEHEPSWRETSREVVRLRESLR